MFHREGDGGLHRGLHGEHPVPAGVPQGLAWLHAQPGTGICPRRRRELGRHREGYRESHHAGGKGILRLTDDIV